MLCTALQLCTDHHAIKAVSKLWQKKARAVIMSTFAALDWHAVLKNAEHLY